MRRKEGSTASKCSFPPTALLAAPGCCCRHVPTRRDTAAPAGLASSSARHSPLLDLSSTSLEPVHFWKLLLKIKIKLINIQHLPEEAEILIIKKFEKNHSGHFLPSLSDFARKVQHLEAEVPEAAVLRRILKATRLKNFYQGIPPFLLMPSSQFTKEVCSHKEQETRE